MSAIHKQNLHFYEFGPFRFDAEERLLFRDQEVVQLTPKVLDTLLVLIENRGHLLRKDDLMNAVWPDTFVEESSLSQNISLLRKALGQQSNGREYIETLPRRGYRFVAEVHEVYSHVRPVLVELAKTSNVEVQDSESNTRIEETDIAVASEPPTSRRKWHTYAVVASVVVAVVLSVYVWRTYKRTLSGSTVKSIAVLPFKTLGAQTETDLAGLGMTDALILRLARIEGVSVLPTSSVIKYVNHGGDALAVGRELGVDAVLDGTVQRSGQRVRVTAQLIQLRDGSTLWSGKFDEQVNDIFVLQDSVSDDLVQGLAFTVANRDKQPLQKRYTNSPEAYELYTVGLYFWNKRSEDGLLKAIEYFQRAIDKDPKFALAHAMLSDSYMLMHHYGYTSIPREQGLEKLRVAATKSFEIDPNLAEAQSAMAVVKAVEGDYEEAVKLYQRALELNPSLATAHLRYGYLLATMGHLDQAIYQMQRAHELDPLSSTINTNLSAYYGFKRQPDESIKYARLAIDTNPEMYHARVNLGEAYESKQMYAEAETEYKALQQHGEEMIAKQQLAYVYAATGRRTEALKLIAELEKALAEHKAPRTSAHNIALVYVALGDHNKAFEWLNKAFDLRALVATDFRYGRKLDPVRNDPRFKELQLRAQERLRQVQESARNQARSTSPTR